MSECIDPPSVNFTCASCAASMTSFSNSHGLLQCMIVSFFLQYVSSPHFPYPSFLHEHAKLCPPLMQHLMSSSFTTSSLLCEGSSLSQAIQRAMAEQVFLFVFFNTNFFSFLSLGHHNIPRPHDSRVLPDACIEIQLIISYKQCLH